MHIHVVWGVADGVETEQASGYDMVTAGDFWNIIDLLDRAGLPPPLPSFAAHVEQMWDYGRLEGGLSLFAINV
jgi:hypothetical protein